MSLASNPWPSFDQEGEGRNEMINRAQPPPRYRPNPIRSEQVFKLRNTNSYKTKRVQKYREL